MPNLNTKMISSFVKTHWYETSMIVLFMIVCIFLIIGLFIKIGGGPEKSDTVVPNSGNYMTGLVIGQQSTQRSDNLYCPDGTSVIRNNLSGNTLNDDLGGGPPFVQLCGHFPTTIQDTDTVVTDVRFANFKDTDTSSKYTWKPVEERCCAKGDINCKYYPAYVVNPDNADTNTAGEICTPGTQKPPICAGNTDCDLMGVCIATDTWKNVKNGAPGLRSGDIYLSSHAKGSPTCPNGMKSDGINLHSGCKSGNSIYLCKK